MEYCRVYYYLLIFLGLIMRSGSSGVDETICFPKDFGFGTATAAYQIEGGWNATGKGVSIWDSFTHTYPGKIKERANGDVADDSYRLFEQDVELLKSLNVKFYRFSMSWSRILPTGIANEINKDGIRYYTEVIDQLLKHNIKPMVTMYHWDLPQKLMDIGGWTNPFVIDIFVDYAQILFDNFGDKVKYWITFNEAQFFCTLGYGLGKHAPGLENSGVYEYMCGHNVVRAHAKTYRLYERKYKQRYNGKIGFTEAFNFIMPETQSDTDKRAAYNGIQFGFGWLTHPIYSKEGDYPIEMRTRVAEKSKQQGFPRSRLPIFTTEEVEMIRGSADFIGFNHYGSIYVTEKKPETKYSHSDDASVKYKRSVLDPEGFRKAVNWIKFHYDNPVIIVTENGFRTGLGLNDTDRVNYLDKYLRALHTAIIEDGCNVQAYTCWSLMDNFEWLSGYTVRLGLHEVDMTTPERTRTPRLSAKFYASVAKSGCLPDKQTTKL